MNAASKRISQAFFPAKDALAVSSLCLWLQFFEAEIIRLNLKFEVQDIAECRNLYTSKRISQAFFPAKDALAVSSLCLWLQFFEAEIIRLNLKFEVQDIAECRNLYTSIKKQIRKVEHGIYLSLHESGSIGSTEQKELSPSVRSQTLKMFITCLKKFIACLKMFIANLKMFIANLKMFIANLKMFIANLKMFIASFKGAATPKSVKNCKKIFIAY